MKVTSASALSSVSQGEDFVAVAAGAELFFAVAVVAAVVAVAVAVAVAVTVAAATATVFVGTAGAADFIGVVGVDTFGVIGGDIFVEEKWLLTGEVLFSSSVMTCSIKMFLSTWRVSTNGTLYFTSSKSRDPVTRNIDPNGDCANIFNNTFSCASTVAGWSKLSTTLWEEGFGEKRRRAATKPLWHGDTCVHK